MPVFMQTMIIEVIFLPEKSLSSSKQLKTFGFLHLQLTVLLQGLIVYSTTVLFCLITTFTHQTDRNTQFPGSQNPPDAWYHWLCTIKENNYCSFFFRLQNHCFQGCAVPHRKTNQHISADDMKKSFDRSARKTVFKYSSLQQFPSFPYPHKDLCSQPWPASSTCCAYGRPRKTWSYLQRARQRTGLACL